MCWVRVPPTLLAQVAPDWLTTKEALDYLGLRSRTTLWKYVKAGFLRSYGFPTLPDQPGVRPGRRYRREDLDALLVLMSQEEVEEVRRPSEDVDSRSEPNQP